MPKTTWPSDPGIRVKTYSRLSNLSTPCRYDSGMTRIGQGNSWFTALQGRSTIFDSCECIDILVRMIERSLDFWVCWVFQNLTFTTESILSRRLFCDEWKHWIGANLGLCRAAHVPQTARHLENLVCESLMGRYVLPVKDYASSSRLFY